VNEVPGSTSLQLRMPKSLIDQIDQQRWQMKLPPSRSQMIRYLIERGLQSEERATPILRRPGVA